MLPEALLRGLAEVAVVGDCDGHVPQYAAAVVGSVHGDSVPEGFVVTFRPPERQHESWDDNWQRALRIFPELAASMEDKRVIAWVGLKGGLRIRPEGPWDSEHVEAQTRAYDQAPRDDVLWMLFPC